MGRLQVLNLAIITLLALDVIFIIILFSSKAIGRRKRELYLEEKRRVIDSVNGESFTPDLKALGIAPLRIFEIFRDFSVTVIFPEKVNRAFIEYFTETGVVRRYCRSISSRRGKKRSEAAINLGFLPTAAVHRALETALVKEKHYSIRVLIISSLIDTGDEVSIPYILQTLIDSPNWYKEKIYSIMGQFGEKFHDFLTGLTSVESKELKMVIIYFANYYFSPRLRELLHGFMDSEDGEIAAAAAGSCVKMYPELLRSEKFLKSLHLEVRKNAVLAAASFPTPESLDMLIGAMKDITLFNTCVSSIHSMVVNDNRLFKQAMARFMSEKNPGLRSGLASALSRKIDYLFTRMRFDKSASLRESIAHIIRLGSLQNTIAFMNENTDQKLEDEVCAIISESLKSSTADKRNEFRLYLNERLLSRLGLTRLEPIKGEPRREVVRKVCW
jgi:hypothetical protein